MCSKQEERKDEGQSRSAGTHAKRRCLQHKSKALESSRALADKTRCGTRLEVVEEGKTSVFLCPTAEAQQPKRGFPASRHLGSKAFNRCCAVCPLIHNSMNGKGGGGGGGGGVRLPLSAGHGSLLELAQRNVHE